MNSLFSTVTNGLDNVKERAERSLLDIVNVSCELQLSLQTCKSRDIVSEELESVLELLDSYKALITRDLDAIERNFGYLKDANAFLINKFDLSPHSPTDALPVQEPLQSLQSIDKDRIIQPDTTQSHSDNIDSYSKCFPRVPKELIQPHTSKQELLYLSAVYELIDTESLYIQDLKTMMNHYKHCMMDSGLYTDMDINILFSNVYELILSGDAFLQRLLDMKELDPYLPLIGYALIESTESFSRIYSIYCGNYPKSSKKLHQLCQTPEIQQHLIKLSNGVEAKGLSLESFIIKPVQRICKYPLLAKELFKYANDTEKDSIEKALESFESILTTVNETSRQVQNREKNILVLEKIDSSIELPILNQTCLIDGNMDVLVNSKLKERNVILYDSILLICKPFKTKYTTKYTLETAYLISELEIRDDYQSKKQTSLEIQLFIISEDMNTLCLFAKNDIIKSKWLESFQIAFARCNESQIIQDFDRKEFESRLNEFRRLKDSIISSAFMNTLKPKGMGVLNEFDLSDTNVQDDQDALLDQDANLDTVIEESPNVELELVSDFPDWRKVSKDDMVYYFNIVTRETRWALDSI